jgi:hypothetical protein
MTVTFPHVRGLAPDMYAVGPAEWSASQANAGRKPADVRVSHVWGLTPGMAKGDA